MGFDISREKLAALREKYPQGCRVELIKMDDPYREMPPGMHGTVTGVISERSMYAGIIAAILGLPMARTGAGSCMGRKRWMPFLRK